MTTDMTEGRIIPQLTEFTIPLVLGNLFQLTYNAADSLAGGQQRPRCSGGSGDCRTGDEYGNTFYQRDVYGSRDINEHPVWSEEI